MSIVAVFDTNILFSGSGWHGAPYECLERARRGVVEGLTCEELLEELTEKLRDKLNFSGEQVAATLIDLATFLKPVTITNTLHVLSDPDDDKVLECAVIGGATHIVTGDKKHLLPLGSYQGIRIVTAREFLDTVSAMEAQEEDTLP